MEWFKRYLMALSVSLAVIFLGTLLYASWVSIPYLETLRGVLIVGIFILVLASLGALFPSFSVFSSSKIYRSLNPIYMRFKHEKKGRKSKIDAIALFAVWLTLLFIYFVIFPH